MRNPPSIHPIARILRPSWLAGLVWAVGSVALAAPPPSARPNILVILADDLGWRDVGFTGNPFHETPRIDSLARDGTVFTQGYANAPNCAPTRACLMTGQYPPRHGVFTVVDDRDRPGSPHQRVMAAESRPELATEAVTLAEVLRDGGYATGMIGMWNLGRGRRGPTTPEGQGFTFTRQPKEMGFETDAYQDGNGHRLTDAMASEGVAFIEDHQSHPWFLYFAPHAVHAPFDPDPRMMEKYQRKAGETRGPSDPALAATVEELDRAVGRLLDTLARLDLARNTLVIFTSDNGGTRQYVAPLRGGKGGLYEGGLRVPLAVRGPGVRPGARCDTPVLSMDFFPTALEYAGVARAANLTIDGVSIRPLLEGRDGFRRDAVYWHFPCYCGNNTPSSALRCGDWKLIESFDPPGLELYDLAHDPGESRDLARTQADRTKELADRLHAWQQATRAPRPVGPNPAFDPQAERPRGRDQRGKGNGGRAPAAPPRSD